jgi:hypothetical protein
MVQPNVGQYGSCATKLHPRMGYIDLHCNTGRLLKIVGALLTS